MARRKKTEGVKINLPNLDRATVEYIIHYCDERGKEDFKNAKPMRWSVWEEVKAKLTELKEELCTKTVC